eukprot:s399_g4.t1
MCRDVWYRQVLVSQATCLIVQMVRRTKIAPGTVAMDATLLKDELVNLCLLWRFCYDVTMCVFLELCFVGQR